MIFILLDLFIEIDRISACVFVKYILSVYECIGEEEQSLMAGETKTASRIQISDFSSIENFSSNLHKHKPLFKGFEGKTNYNII